MLTRLQNLPVGLLYRPSNGVYIKRAETSQVDDFGLDAFLRELFRSLKAMGDHFAMGYQSDIAAFALNFAFSDWEEKIIRHCLCGHGEGNAVEHFIFKEDNGAGITNGRLWDA
jgi:hypothetical protein